MQAIFLLLFQHPALPKDLRTQCLLLRASHFVSEFSRVNFCACIPKRIFTYVLCKVRTQTWERERWKTTRRSTSACKLAELCVGCENTAKVEPLDVVSIELWLDAPRSCKYARCGVSRDASLRLGQLQTTNSWDAFQKMHLVYFG